MNTKDAIKQAVCDYLLEVNKRAMEPWQREMPFIPPTAINWLGDGITSAVIEALYHRIQVSPVGA